MPFPAKIYSQEQTEAVIRAIVEHRMTAREAITAAAKGELGCPPFDMPLGTARRYAARRREAQDRIAHDGKPPTREQVEELALTIALRELEKVDKRQRVSTAEPDWAVKRLGIAKAALQVAGGPARNRATSSNGSTTEEQHAEQTSRDRIAQRLNDSEPEPPTVQTGPSPNADVEEPPRNTETTSTTTTEDSDQAQVLSGAQASTVDLTVPAAELEAREIACLDVSL